MLQTLSDISQTFTTQFVHALMFRAKYMAKSLQYFPLATARMLQLLVRENLIPAEEDALKYIEDMNNLHEDIITEGKLYAVYFGIEL